MPGMGRNPKIKVPSADTAGAAASLNGQRRQSRQQTFTADSADAAGRGNLSDLGLLGDIKGIVHVDAQVADRTFKPMA